MVWKRSRQTHLLLEMFPAEKFWWILFFMPAQLPTLSSLEEMVPGFGRSLGFEPCVRWLRVVWMRYIQQCQERHLSYWKRTIFLAMRVKMTTTLWNGVQTSKSRVQILSDESSGMTTVVGLSPIKRVPTSLRLGIRTIATRRLSPDPNCPATPTQFPFFFLKLWGCLFHGNVAGFNVINGVSYTEHFRDINSI